MGNTRGGVLSVRTHGDESVFELEGTREDILFNWIAATHQVCKALNVPPYLLAAAMPVAVQEYLQHALKFEIKFDGRAGDRK